jgi:hypothetical protein
MPAVALYGRSWYNRLFTAQKICTVKFFYVLYVLGMNVTVGALHVLFSFNLFFGEITYSLV